MRRIISIVTAAAIICSVLTGAVCAKPELSAKFKDIKESDWFAEYVGKLNILKIIDGLPDGSFNPQGEVTRAQFIKMLVQAMEYNKVDSISFDDIKPFATSKPHWASVYIETALRNGVIVKAGIGSSFYPDVPLTRKDMAMMMFRALKLTPSDGENPFADLTEANGCFTRLYEEYLIRGIIADGKRLFNPEGLTTRAEAAAIISRMVDYKADPKGFVVKSAMEERFKDGIQTAEDIALKRQIEIVKAKADPNYIMEPIITVETNTDPWIYEYFNLYFENMSDYPDAAKWQLECANYTKLNEYEMPKPNGTFVKRSITNWRSLGSKYKDEVRASSYVLGRNYYTTQSDIKDFKIMPGMQIKFKITVQQGNKTKVIYKAITVNDITFKG